MNDEILRKYSGNRGLGLESDAEVESDAENLGAFGWIRSSRDRCVTLELRKKDGHIMAIAYVWIERAEYDPSVGITLHAHGQKLHIRGRNLNAEVRPTMRLFQGICRNRVPWVREADLATDLTAAHADTVIEQIEW